jgi:transcriptional regulator GlxA family with amidase domain
MLQWYVSTKAPLRDPAGEVIGLAGVMYPISTPEEQAAMFREIYPVIRHFEENFRGDVDMKAMAKLAGLSSTQFNKRFRDLLRIPPTEYLLRLRIQEAQRLLAGGSAGIAEVAAETGFCDQSHFTKRFRRVTGMTPLSYRKRFR